jgi:5-methylthioadenosine/S-adenosylhomocysteine deaminase
MPAVPADLSISPRWILPMTAPQEVFENHSLIVRDGRILDLLPRVDAALRYAPTVHLDRPDHLLLPGLVNAQTRIGPNAARSPRSGQPGDDALLCIAEMLKAGTTCFSDMGYFPEESARTAGAQGMRVLVGIPIAETPSAWAKTADEYLTRALALRDEYRGHPSIGTAFAPHAAAAISDATFGRIATLANELDAGIVMALHQSRAEIDESLARHGLRPLERMQALGLLTPALTAVHMAHVNAADIALAQRSGIAVTFCAGSNMRAGFGPPPVASWVGTGLRLGMGTGIEDWGASLDLWSELKLLAWLSRTADSNGMTVSAWDALALATRGGAAALGLESEIGTLETGKWADLCCVELRNPAMLRACAAPPLHDARAPSASALVFNGGRDLVSDVWVSGRHLLNGGAFTRLDWPDLASRMSVAPDLTTTGVNP